MSDEIIITDPFALQLLDVIENTPEEQLLEKLREMGVTLNDFTEFVKAASLQEDPLVKEILENFRASAPKTETADHRKLSIGQRMVNEPADELEAGWFQKFKAGDERVFNQIYERHVRGIQLFLRSKVKDEETAEEAAVKVFMKVWNNRGKIENEEHLRRYLYATARTIAIDHLRQKKRWFWQIGEHEDVPADDIDRIDAQIMQAELLNGIWTRIEQLPGKSKEILRMYFFEQMTTDEIAFMLDMTPQAVRNAKVRSLEKLRKWFSGTDMLLLALVLYFSLEAEKQAVDHSAPQKIEKFRFHLS